MHIEINANGFDLTDPIADHVRARLDKELRHLREKLTRIEAHLGDHNAHKKSDSDKRCMLEARPKNMDPIAVTAEHSDLYEAVTDAAAKLRRALDTRFGKQHDAAR